MQVSHLNRTRTLTVSGFLFIGLLSGALHAQESQALETVANSPEASEKEVKPIPVEVPVSDAATESEDEMLFLMDDFVVSAGDDQGYYSANTLAGTRTNELTKNIPMTISTVNQEMLQDFNMSTLDQLGTFVPSIESEGSSFNNQEIRFRGFLTRSQLFEFMPRYSPLDYYNVDRADIIRGANSLIYGQADPGGKINIISKMANLSKNHRRYSVDFGNKNYSKFTLDYNQTLGDRAAVRVLATDRSEEYNQRYKSYDFTGVTLESTFLAKNNKTQFRIHAEYIDVMRGHADQAFKDNSAISGLSGMPQNIVADSRIAGLMSDEMVRYIAEYNTSDPATGLRSIYPNNLYKPKNEGTSNDRDGALIPDYITGDTLGEQRQSIREYYAGITPEISGTAQGPDAFRKTNAGYFIGDVTHRFTDQLEMKVAFGMEYSKTDSRIRTGANTLKRSLGYGKGVNIPVSPGDPRYDELFYHNTNDPNYGKTSTYDKIINGAYGDIGGLRSLSATDFKDAIDNSVKTWMVNGMTLDQALDLNNNKIVDIPSNNLVIDDTNRDLYEAFDQNDNGIIQNNERFLEAGQQADVIRNSVYGLVARYRKDSGLEEANATNFAFMQALQAAQGQLNETLPDGTTERGFIGWALDFLYSTIATNNPIDDKGDNDPTNDEINPANDGQIGEVNGFYLEPLWEEWSNSDLNKSVRTTFSYQPDFKFLPGKQQFLLGLDLDRRNGGSTKYAQIQDGVLVGPNGVILSQEVARDYLYLTELLEGKADDKLDYDETQEGFTPDGTMNSPNSGLVRDGKLAANKNNQTFWQKTHDADTEVETIGTWMAASGSYLDGRIRTLLGARMDYITVETDLHEYKAAGSNVAVKNDEPLENNSSLNFVEFSPSLGALFWITEELGIFGNFAESVISPTGFSYDVFGKITPPETGRGIELGLKYSSMDGKINAQLTAFRIDKKNEQRNNVTYPQLKAMFPRVSTGDPNDTSNPNVIEKNAPIWRPNFDETTGEVRSYSFDPVGSRVADEEARSEGIELDVYYNPNKNISIFMGYAYLDTTVLKSSLDSLEDLTVPGTAHHSANAQIRYTFNDGPLKGYFIGCNQKYRSAALLNTYFADLDRDGEEDFFGLDEDGDGIYETPAEQFALRLEDNLQTDFFLGWGGALGKGRNAPRGRVQLTLLNAFNAIDLISTGANNARYTESRSIRLSANLSF